jgi:hypothetical protein
MTIIFQRAFRKEMVGWKGGIFKKWTQTKFVAHFQPKKPEAGRTYTLSLHPENIEILYI